MRLKNKLKISKQIEVEDRIQKINVEYCRFEGVSFLFIAYF
jgi:hypothetical protein